jgi:hypothetical protein
LSVPLLLFIAGFLFPPCWCFGMCYAVCSERSTDQWIRIFNVLNTSFSVILIITVIAMAILIAVVMNNQTDVINS